MRLNLSGLISYSILILLLPFFSFTMTTNNEPVDVTAGKMTYKWEVEKVFLERSNNINPVLTQGKSTLKANMIMYDNKSETGYAFGNVYYRNDEDQIILTSGEGTYKTRLKEIVVKDNPKILMLKDNTVARSDLMKIYPEKDIVLMLGNVNITNTNFIIGGDEATLYQKTGKMIVIGNASACQQNTVITADKFDVQTRKGALDTYTAIGKVKIDDLKQGYTINSGRLDYYKEIGYSRITDHPVITFTNKNTKAYSIYMEKFDKEETANLMGNVVIVNDTKKAYSKWGYYYMHIKKMLLTGSPYVIDNQSKFQSDRIIYDINSETLNMIGKGAGYYQY
ncbi:MAG: LptA/OstA family protein [Brevinematales bacterium]